MRPTWSRTARPMVVALLVIGCTSATSPSPTSTSSAPTGPTASAPTSSPAARGAITAIAGGSAHTCALTRAGAVRCWGYHGSGAATQSIVPVDVAGLANGVSAITAGRFHTCAVTGGGVKCWGANNLGQLGDGTTTDSLVPVDVVGLASGVRAVSAGGSHTCALTTAGGVQCWGANSIGQLGNGTTTDSLAPVDVVGLASGARVIAAAEEHTCAVTDTGAVSCWGYNHVGQLGNGTATNSPFPVDVVGLASGVTAIAARRSHTCAITAVGGVKCWGSNSFGGLGNATMSDSLAPVDVAGLASGVGAIAVGDLHSCAVTGGGQVRCWGYNSAGQVGDGTTTDSPIPVAVAGLASGVIAIEAGGSHSCALTNAGAVRCWGDNSYWQLGSRGLCSNSSSVPVDVAFPVPADGEPIATPRGPIDHATGPSDIVLRFDIGPDLVVANQFSGDVFRPGPEFTLFGDGTTIFRDDRADLAAAEGPIARARPFEVAHLDEDQIGSILMFALGEGGIAESCERYEAPATDDTTRSAFTVRAGGLDKRVDVLGSANPLQALADHLRTFGEGGTIPTRTWVADRYQGSLFEAGGAIEIGLLPDPRDVGIVPWPWPSIAPGEFRAPGDSSGGIARRVMSAAEAAVHGFSNNGGIVKRAYLRGPDGKTVYAFYLWPMLPDESS